MFSLCSSDSATGHWALPGHLVGCGVGNPVLRTVKQTQTEEKWTLSLDKYNQNVSLRAFRVSKGRAGGQIVHKTKSKLTATELKKSTSFTSVNAGWYFSLLHCVTLWNSIVNDPFNAVVITFVFCKIDYANSWINTFSAWTEKVSSGRPKCFSVTDNDKWKKNNSWAGSTTRDYKNH